MKTLGNIQEYHQRTKHYPDRYARSPGYMDWSNQPNPFRFYTGADRLELPLLKEAVGMPYGVLYDAPAVEPVPIALASIAALLELGMGLSAWKAYGASEWSLRMNPSSGNLHPTEAYLLLPETGGMPACIGHYNPLLHCLEVRHHLDAEAANSLEGLGGFGVILSSIFWREAWKYGERAFRYTQHDIGHALGALRFSAALQGWRLETIPEIKQEVLDRLLGFTLERQIPGETEKADCFCWVSPRGRFDAAVLDWVSSLPVPEYPDGPNQLSPSVVSWPVIDQAAVLTESPGYTREEPAASTGVVERPSTFDAMKIVRQRRSAQAYDSSGSRMDYASFRAILQATLPNGGAPFDVLCVSTSVHLFLFVHRVDGVEPGLYCLLRDENYFDRLKENSKGNFLWQRIDEELPLYLLQPGDYIAMAESISCHQAIAGDSAFSLGMLAYFEPVLDKAPWRYPPLFWEAGLIGQVLYLEAEAHGFRGTGIGCYFDDVMHELLGLVDSTWQDLYHFTIGTPIEDGRLQTRLPYHHLAELRERWDD